MSANVTGYYNLGVGPEFTITGNSALCGPGNYSVNNLPAGSTVTWSASPAILGFNPNPGNPTVVTPTGGTGTVTLTANIVSTCGNRIITTPIQITTAPGIGISTYNNLEYCYEGVFKILPSPSPSYYPYSGSLTVGGASSYSWALAPNTYNSGVTWTDMGNGTVSLTAKLSNAHVTLRVTGTTACGTQYKDYSFNVQCLAVENVAVVGGFEISPNPANTILKVEVDKEGRKIGKQIASIELIDKMGNVILRNQYSPGTTKVNLSVGQFPNDVYTLRVFDGTIWSSYKIMIQH